MGGQSKRAWPLRQQRRAAFTLVEVLLVVVILAVLAGAVVSQFSGSADDARDAVLRQNLQGLRRQLELFKVQHDGHLPGWTAAEDLEGHLFAYSNRAGAISLTPSTSYPYGPYFVPTTMVNPFNNGRGVMPATTPSLETPDETLTTNEGSLVGWFYNLQTGEIAANAEGTGPDGTPRIQY